MANEKLTIDMTVYDMIYTMSEGNPGAMEVLMEMMSDTRLFMDILLCDSLNIRGSKLYMLYNDCCGKNKDKFARTLKMLRSGIFSSEQIQSNFELVYALPFIDDNIVVDGVPVFGDEFGPGHEKWEEYCARNKESFKKRLESALENRVR